MKKINYKIAIFFFIGAVTLVSCKKYLDINTDPDNIVSTNAPLPQLLTSAQVNVAFEGGSDLYRYSNIIRHLSPTKPMSMTNTILLAAI
jgi:hypothetical protein